MECKTFYVNIGDRHALPYQKLARRQELYHISKKYVISNYINIFSKKWLIDIRLYSFEFFYSHIYGAKIAFNAHNNLIKTINSKIKNYTSLLMITSAILNFCVTIIHFILENLSEKSKLNVKKNT